MVRVDYMGKVFRIWPDPKKPHLFWPVCTDHDFTESELEQALYCAECMVGKNGPYPIDPARHPLHPIYNPARP